MTVDSVGRNAVIDTLLAVHNAGARAIVRAMPNTPALVGAGGAHDTNVVPLK